VRLLLSLLRIPYNRVEIDIEKEENRTEEFLKNVSSGGKLPVLILPRDYHQKLSSRTSKKNDTIAESAATPKKVVIDDEVASLSPFRPSDDIDLNPKIPDDGITFTESNAILTLLSEGTSLFPRDPIDRAQVMQWLFWEQYSLTPNISPLRRWITYMGVGEESEYLDRIVEKQKQGYEALHLMEEHLRERKFFVGEAFTIVDIALYAYTHVGEEAGYSVDSFPMIRAWFHRVEQMAGFIPIND
ncbi:6938_t:CDS:2, partial [Acaulospora morrowiae]